MTNVATICSIQGSIPYKIENKLLAKQTGA